MYKEIDILGRKIYYREDKKDLAVIKEVVLSAVYQKKTFGLTQEAGDKWLDLGANIGAFGFLVETRGGEVISFEPEMENFKLLVKNTKGKKIRSLVTTMKEDMIPLYGPPNTTDNSRFTIIPKVRYKEVGLVKNTFVGDLQDKFDFNCVKMDIEGSELTMIDMDVFPKVDKMVLEYHFSVDRSMDNFRRRVRILSQYYNVHHAPGLNNMQKFPKGTKFPGLFDQFIFCLKK